ncbi:hypothetical protein SeMB42_g01652 [Synchytrium endobioticum]|uniref:Uncharacterized protein n=1 Tax=Synchytrium endobioticum TaxID=286115 RepID=A0A507DKB2_9FUNG|nr:hypothetical protein SeMB42_g01652 [Synchytrium endobioticum]
MSLISLDHTSICWKSRHRTVYRLEKHLGIYITELEKTAIINNLYCKYTKSIDRKRKKSSKEIKAKKRNPVIPYYIVQGLPMISATTSCIARIA